MQLYLKTYFKTIREKICRRKDDKTSTVYRTLNQINFRTPSSIPCGSSPSSTGFSPALRRIAGANPSSSLRSVQVVCGI